MFPLGPDAMMNFLNFVKRNKIDIILVSVLILLLILFVAGNAYATEVSTDMDAMPESGHYAYVLHTLIAVATENQKNIEAILQKIETLQELQYGFNHWTLALMGMQVSLLAILIFAVAWGRR
jgi:hypothetical protein